MATAGSTSPGRTGPPQRPSSTQSWSWSALRKLDPGREKTEVNAAFAAKFGLQKKKSTRRKARRARTLQRETTWLVLHGIDPTESEAPIA
jgi:hypothetical protein